MGNQRDAAPDHLLDQEGFVRHSVTLALILSTAMVCAGCSSLRPGSHPNFEAWFVGDPAHDYEIVELRGRSPLFRMTHAYLTWPLFLVRDSLRITFIPVFLTHYALFRPEADAGGDNP